MNSTKRQKRPFPFLLDELEQSPLAPRLRTRPMFGSLAIYVDERIVFILRKKQQPDTLRDDGLWIAAPPAHQPSLILGMPSLRPIEMFQNRGRKGFSDWLNLPELEEAFEESALHACRLVIAGDPRIGKLPNSRSKP